MSLNACKAASPPLQSTAAQWGVGVALLVLMTATRGQHFASVDALPSASWAVFFLAGAALRPAWLLPVLFAWASVLDLASLRAGTISDRCLSPAYWALQPAYASLWLGGRIYADAHRTRWSTLPPLALMLVVAALVAYLCSGGGFYFFSGRYPDPSLSGFIGRFATYYPRSLGTLAGYVGIALAMHALVAHWSRRRPAQARAA